jgi:glycosyltransferase involved in cell wall biosynthesis
MKVCMLLHKSAAHDSRVLREARALSAAGHEVSIVQLSPPRRLPRPVFWCWLSLAFVFQVVRLRPDIVHAHDTATLPSALVGARIARARVVYDSHELSTGVPYRSRLGDALAVTVERHGLHRCAAVITVSDAIADVLRRRYSLRAQPTVVRNVPDLGRARPASGPSLRERAGAMGKPVVLYQGAASPFRGCENLVRALALVDQQTQLVFLGSSEARFTRKLRDLAQQEAVEGRVHFIASVPEEELISYAADADVGVWLLEDNCDNHRLTLPNKLFEYIASGLPVVAADLPAGGGLVRDRGVGWTVDAGDARSIADGLAGALAGRNDPALRARLRMAADDLQWSREQERLLGLYDSLAGGGGARRDPARSSLSVVALVATGLSLCLLAGCGGDPPAPADPNEQQLVEGKGRRARLTETGIAFANTASGTIGRECARRAESKAAASSPAAELREAVGDLERLYEMAPRARFRRSPGTPLVFMRDVLQATVFTLRRRSVCGGGEAQRLARRLTSVLEP